MIAVIFEVTPAADQRDTYLDHAARLRPKLANVEGFISVERFQSLTDPDKVLSLSFLEDEAAVARWRTQSEHRAIQDAGRAAGSSPTSACGSPECCGTMECLTAHKRPVTAVPNTGKGLP